MKTQFRRDLGAVLVLDRPKHIYGESIPRPMFERILDFAILQATLLQLTAARLESFVLEAAKRYEWGETQYKHAGAYMDDEPKERQDLRARRLATRTLQRLKSAGIIERIGRDKIWKLAASKSPT